MFLLKYLFPKKKAVTLGSIWVHENTKGNPFSKVTYKVLDVKNDWVKYACLDRNDELLFQESDSCTIRTFYSCYYKIREGEQEFP